MLTNETFPPALQFPLHLNFQRVRDGNTEEEGKGGGCWTNPCYPTLATSDHKLLFPDFVPSLLSGLSPAQVQDGLGVGHRGLSAQPA